MKKLLILIVILSILITYINGVKIKENSYDHVLPFATNSAGMLNPGALSMPTELFYGGLLDSSTPSSLTTTTSNQLTPRFQAKDVKITPVKSNSPPPAATAKVATAKKPSVNKPAPMKPSIKSQPKQSHAPPTQKKTPITTSKKPATPKVAAHLKSPVVKQEQPKANLKAQAPVAPPAPKPQSSSSSSVGQITGTLSSNSQIPPQQQPAQSPLQPTQSQPSQLQQMSQQQNPPSQQQQQGQNVRFALASPVAISEATDQNFRQFVSNSKVAIVFFYAKDCKKCKDLHTLFKSLAKKLQEEKLTSQDVNLIKVNALNCPNTVNIFRIDKSPTLLLFKDGHADGEYKGLFDVNAIFLKLNALLQVEQSPKPKVTMPHPPASHTPIGPSSSLAHKQGSSPLSKLAGLTNLPPIKQPGISANPMNNSPRLPDGTPNCDLMKPSADKIRCLVTAIREVQLATGIGREMFRDEVEVMRKAGIGGDGTSKEEEEEEEEEEDDEEEEKEAAQKQQQLLLQKQYKQLQAQHQHLQQQINNMQQHAPLQSNTPKMPNTGSCMSLPPGLNKIRCLVTEIRQVQLITGIGRDMFNAEVKLLKELNHHS